MVVRFRLQPSCAIARHITRAQLRSRHYGTPSRQPPPPGSASRQAFEPRRTSFNWLRNASLVVGGGGVLLSLPSLLSDDASQSFSARLKSWSLTTSSSSAPSNKLEMYQHNPLSITSTSFYPDAASSSDHKHLRVALPQSSKPNDSGSLAERLRIRSLYIKEPSLVIERAYTPLYDTFSGSASLATILPSDLKTSDLYAEVGSVDLLVKRYPDGELSRYLHRLPTGATVEARGPIDTWNWTRDHGTGTPLPDEIVLIVGGTGITPAYQLLTNVLGQPSARSQNDVTADAALTRRPQFRLLYAAPDLPNALLLPQLQELVDQNDKSLDVSLFLETVPSTTIAVTDKVSLRTISRTSWNPLRWLQASSGDVSHPSMHLIVQHSQGAGPPIPVYNSRITPAHLTKILNVSDPTKRLILICGPDGMVHYLAGPKSRDGRSQGPLRGVLAQLGYSQDQVFKL